jgi:hypothetical protein
MEGKKFDEGKPRVDLVDPDFVLELSKVLTMGADKYGPYNWARGMAWSRPTAALQRHLAAWQKGENIDPESGLSHLAHVAANVMFLMYFQQNGVGEDDRGFKEKPTWADNIP